MNQCLVAAMVLTIAFRMNVLHSERLEKSVFLTNVTAHSQLQATMLDEPACKQTYEGLIEDTTAEGKVCCDRSCKKCGGEGCGEGGNADKCCTNNIMKHDKLCSADQKAPCVLKCDIGDETPIPGLVGEDKQKQQKVCCPLGCGRCGGQACSHAKPGADACCVDKVAKKTDMCSETKMAPCVLKKPQAEPQQCNDHWKGFIGETSNDEKVCCPEECGQCGGPNCGKLGAKKCCISNVLDAGKGKKCSQTQGPPCVLKFSSADGLLAGSASWALPVLFAIASTQHF